MVSLNCGVLEDRRWRPTQKRHGHNILAARNIQHLALRTIVALITVMVIACTRAMRSNGMASVLSRNMSVTHDYLLISLKTNDWLN